MNTPLLKEPGLSLIYVSASSGEIYLVGSICDSHLLYITLDKAKRTVLGVSSVDLSALNHENVEFISWYKPTFRSSGDHEFHGVCKIGARTTRFSLNKKAITIGKDITLSPSYTLGVLNCLKDIKVESHIQRGNTIYAVGLDTYYNEQVFLEVDMVTDTAVRRYNLRSDLGDLKVNSMALDSESCKVLLAGDISKYDNRDRLVSTHPFFDTFLT